MIYRHFKGKYYLKIAEITQGSTLQPGVLYFPLYGKPRLFFRTLSDFSAIVYRSEYNYCGERFKKVSIIDCLKRSIFGEKYMSYSRNVNDNNHEEELITEEELNELVELTDDIDTLIDNRFDEWLEELSEKELEDIRKELEGEEE